MAEKDKHTSPANPDNQIGLERQSADREAMADTVRHPLTPPEDQKGEGPPLNQPPPGKTLPRKGARKTVRGRSGHKVTEVASTGHSWDGITEYDNPMPRWWLWTFYATVVWAVGYSIAYPAWPLISGTTRGLLGYSYHESVERDIQAVNTRNAPIEAALVSTPLDEIADDPDLNNYAINAGAAVFRTWCAQCHGSGAAGSKGYPNLLDNDWLWGGTLEDIHATVSHGIRSPTDDETRYSEMPRFGVDGMLDKTEIKQVANYVLSLSGPAPDATAAKAGAEIFEDNCVACHGDDGTGDRMQGAPDLTDAVWLYGDSLAEIEKIIHDGPFGVMPAWSGRLSEAEIRSVATYVHQLGGGE